MVKMDQSEYFSMDGKLTYISPSTNDIIDIIPAKREIHNTFVDGPAASLRGQILLCYPDPPQGLNRKPDWLLMRLCFLWL